jgi:hypothetical protein
MYTENQQEEGCQHNQPNQPVPELELSMDI